MKHKPPAPCHTCPNRTWRSIDGFMVLGCRPKGLRFGIAPDFKRGYVNRAGGCVPMPMQCSEK